MINFLVVFNNFVKKYCRLLVFLLLIVFFMFPTYYIFVNTPEGKVFSGQAVWFDPHDVNVYVSVINWAQNFGLNFQSAYTTQGTKDVIMYPFYTLLGLVFPKANPFFVYNLAIIPTGLALLYCIYKCLCIFVKKKIALPATVLVVLGGGLGWAFINFYNRYYPLLPDLWIGTFTFSGVFLKPHQIFAMILYVLAPSLYFLGVNKKSMKLIILASISALPLFMIYPYEALFLYLFFALYSVSQREKKYVFKYFVIFAAITLSPTIAHSFYLVSGTNFKNVINPDLAVPGVLSLIIGYAPLLPFIFNKLFTNKRDRSEIFLLTWFFVGIGLSFSGLSFARYYLRGLFFPAIALSIEQIFDLGKKSKKIGRVLVVLIITSLILTSLVIFFLRLRRTGKMENWRYIDKSDYEILTYLRQNTHPKSGILADFPFANFIPAYTINRVYYGHPFQTPGAGGKKVKQKNFLSGELSETQATKFLQDNNIDYVSVPVDGVEVIEKTYPFFQIEYSNGKRAIFRLKS